MPNRKENASSFPELLTGAEARKLAGISTCIWLEMLETDMVPKPVKCGPRFKWRRADILSWIASMDTVGLLEDQR